MKLINQSTELWQQPEGETGIYKQIERAARLCYRSEDKITEDSYTKFMGMLSEKGHNSPFEHGTVYLRCDSPKDVDLILGVGLFYSPYVKAKSVYSEEEGTVSTYVSTNYRVLAEKDFLDRLKYLCAPTEYHERRISVHITTSRSISHELVRHRAFSFSQESQRYCAYNKDRFGGEVTFIKPTWCSLPTGSYSVEGGYPKGHDECPGIEKRYINALMNAEYSYLSFMEDGWKPQQAREVLPNATKTELVMTGFESDWEQFFKLRCSPAAHPMMRELANQMKSLIQNNYAKLGNN